MDFLSIIIIIIIINYYYKRYYMYKVMIVMMEENTVHVLTFKMISKIRYFENNPSLNKRLYPVYHHQLLWFRRQSEPAT